MAALATAMVLTLAGCPTTLLDDKDDKKKNSGSARSNRPSRSPAGPAAAPAGWQKIGGQTNGLTVSVPGDWQVADFSAAEIESNLENLDLPGTNKQMLQQSLSVLRTRKAVFAVDPASASSGFANNINGFCQPGSPSIEALRSQAEAAFQQLGATNIQVLTTNVAGRPAVKVSYGLTAGAADLKGLQAQVPDASGKVCILTVTAQRSSFPPEADRILDTFQAVNQA